MPTDAPTPQAPIPNVTPTSGQISLTLQGSYVVVPISMYDQLLGVALDVQNGKYVPAREIEDRIRTGVQKAISAMNRALATAAQTPATSPSYNTSGVERGNEDDVDTSSDGGDGA